MDNFLGFEIGNKKIGNVHPAYVNRTSFWHTEEVQRGSSLLGKQLNYYINFNGGSEMRKIGLIVAAVGLIAVNVAPPLFAQTPHPTCDHCQATYIPKSELVSRPVNTFT